MKELIYCRFYPKYVQNYADWTQESTCKTLTSCSCGILNNHKWLTDKVKNKINSFHKFQYASIWNNYGWPEQRLGENRRKISRRQKRGIIFHFIVKHEEIIKDFHMSLFTQRIFQLHKSRPAEEKDQPS